MNQYNVNGSMSQSSSLTPFPKVATKEKSTNQRPEKRLVQILIHKAKADADARKVSLPHTVWYFLVTQG